MRLEIAEDDSREEHEPSAFERAVVAIDGADHRGVIQGEDPASRATWVS